MRLARGALVIVAAACLWLAAAVAGLQGLARAQPPVPPAREAAVPAAASAAGGVQRVVTAEFCRGPQAGANIGQAPPTGCAWQPVSLPHLWAGAHEPATSDAWFRLHLHLDEAPVNALAVYITGFNRTGRLFANGGLVGAFGSMQEPLPLNWNRTQYAVIPPALLHAGDNTLVLQQRIYRWERGWLSPVQIGPEAALRPVWERRHFFQNELVRILGATTCAVGVFMLGVWLGRRERAMYLWFGLNCLVWTAISLDYFALYPPLPAEAWEDFIEAAQVLRGVTMCIFVLRYAGLRRPALEAAMWTYLAAGSLGIFTHLLHGRAVDDWYLVSLIASPYFFWVLVRAALRENLAEGVMFGIATGVQIVLSAYDLWLYSRHTWSDLFYLAHFSVALYLLVVGGGLLRHFVESLTAHQRLAAVLEQRVAGKAAELERNYEQLVEARRSETLAVERTRIMSEMHDGIGSQLTLALSLVSDAEGEDGRVARVLRESIEDLQLIIDSLEPVENDLLTVLGMLRYRLQGRLSQSGIELRWNVVDLPPLPMLTPHSVLSILRIVQEAFANCIKHSGARTIAVSTELAGTPGVDETASIRIVDDGRGFRAVASHPPAAGPEPRAAAAPRRGRGLDNMARRAAALGAKLQIVSAPGRTEVLLAIPTQRQG